MSKIISSSLFTSVSCALIQNLLSKSADCEKELHILGQKISKPLLHLYTEKREHELFILLQNLTFVFLDHLYKSNRHIKKVSRNVFVLYEENPLFSRFVSDDSLFCADAIIAGVIEEYMRASGYENTTEAHLQKDNGCIYVITIDEKDITENDIK